MKKLLRCIAFVLCACLCACLFVACDNTSGGGIAGGDNGGGESGGNKPAVTRTWKEMLESDDMKNVFADMKSTMSQGGETMESAAEYHRDGNKYMCKSEFRLAGSSETETVTEYFEHSGEKWYIYHTTPDNVNMKTEMDEDGRYDYTFGNGSSSSEISLSFTNITMVEGFIAKLIAEESNFDNGADVNGAKVYTLEGDMIDIYLSMAPSETTPPEGITMTGTVKITVKSDKVEKIVFAAVMGMNGQNMSEAEMSYEFTYGNVTVTLPKVAA